VNDPPEELQKKTPAEMEAWFLDALSEPELFSAIAAMRDTSAPDQAAGCCELLQEALAERKDAAGMLSLMVLLSGWHGQETPFRGVCRRGLEAVFKSRLEQAFLESVGLGDNVPVGECLRRLGVLTRLAPGVFCHDGTWGFGVIGRLDDFYRRVTIDFSTKPGHGMSFAYAAETLEIVGNDHLLARRHTDPEGLSTLVRDDPGEVIRIALRSYGPLSAVQLREMLVDNVLPESGWKTFWDTARKVLKADPLVDMGAKRSQPIRLLEKEKDYGDDWFAGLKAERDPAEVLARVHELEREGDTAGLDSGALEILKERISYAIRACEGTRWDMAARLVLAADRLGIAAGTDDAARAAELLASREVFPAATCRMPARDVRSLIGYLAGRDAGRAAELLLLLLSQLQPNAVGEAVEFLVAGGLEQELTDKVRGLFDSRQAGVVLTYWLCRNTDRFRRWLPGQEEELAVQAIEALEESCSGELLRAQNQLRALFGRKDWLSGIFDGLEDKQRERLLRRIRDSGGWDESSRRSVMGRLIKLYPGLAEVMASHSPGSEQAGPSRLTSWRTYRERSQQLRVLLEEKIPENSREIAVARSYGDLSENFEYQAAKDQQRLLLQRQHELERDLKEIRGTDFDAFGGGDAAGMGTMVRVQDAEGGFRQYCILGEWDSDLALGIISSGSRLAEILTGHRAGDDVELPTARGTESCRIVEVGGLPAAVKSWIGGE
jgi:transcription elongation GreA/GreB family factor